jgi:hypothetical protein
MINDCGIGEVTDNELDGLNQAFGYVIGDFARRKVQQEYAKDPAKWARDKLGVEFHHKQVETGMSIVHNRNTAVAAGHGTGKSFSAAIFAAWWVDTHPLGSAYVATTAPSFDQISEVIFRELKRVLDMSNDRAEKGLIPKDWALAGRIGEDNTWKIERAGRLVTVMKGRKPPDSKAGDAFQGLHARYVLAIGDEATGLTEEMIDGLANITSNDTSRRLLISNPTNPFSHLGKIFLKPTYEENGAPTWHKIHVSVFDLPTFHGGGRCHVSCTDKELHDTMPWGLGHSREALESMSGPQFVSNKKAEYGEESARYKARVMGEFAFEAGSTLFSDKDIATAVDAIVVPSSESRPVLGVDVARFGADSTFIYRVDYGTVMRRTWSDDLDSGTELEREPALDDHGYPVLGFRIRLLDSWKDAPLVTRHMPDRKTGQMVEEMGTSEMVHQHAMAIGAGEVRVDASGIGSSVIDRLWELKYESNASYTIVEMQSGSTSPDRRAWYNNRAFQLDNMRKLFFQGRVDMDGQDEQLIDELMGIIYEFADAASGGGLKIESKESMKKRGVKSPDAADAAWMSLADLTHLFEGPLAGKLPGDEFLTDVDDMQPAGRDWWNDYIF